MLSRAVCEKCKKTTFAQKRGCGWSPKSVELWNNGNGVACPVVKLEICIGKVRARDDNPPEKCPYRFEHAVAVTMGEEDVG